MKEKQQYYRERKVFLVRAYCDCGGELRQIDKEIYKCVKCKTETTLEKEYPFWKPTKKKQK